MADILRNDDWEVLIERIKNGNCTPFLGAGASYGRLPLGGEIARRWSEEYGYPFEDSNDLIRVSQFLALKRDRMFPKEQLVKMLNKTLAEERFDPTTRFDPHWVLAGLRIPVYITTNYDDFMVQALKGRDKEPRRELCRWNSYTRRHPSIFDGQPGFKPTVANPVVFHLHGNNDMPESLVLTEDDYLDFLVNLSLEPGLVPFQIQQALMSTTLLFVGYRIADWSFRVLLRTLSRFMEPTLKRINVAVMLAPQASETTEQKVQEYLTEYYKNIDVRVYWGTAEQFLTELLQRMKN